MKIKVLCLLVVYLICFNMSYAATTTNNNNSQGNEGGINEKLTPEYIEQNISSLDVIKSGKKSSYTPQIRQAIKCYKGKNYTTCLQLLKEVEEKEPYNSVVTYYLGLTNLKLGKQDEALNYFKSTSLLDPSSIVGKYATKTMEVINNPEVVNQIEEKIQEDEIETFLKSGKQIAPEVSNQMSKTRLDVQKDEINHNIKEETKDLKQQKMQENIQRQKMQNEENKAAYPTNDEIAQAVKTFQKMGLNPFNINVSSLNQLNSEQAKQMQSINQDMMQLNMMLGQNNNSNNNNMMNMLPFMMMSNNNPNSNFKMTPEMIQTMVMSQMMPNLDFNMSNNNRN